jgi:threonine aldolase
MGGGSVWPTHQLAQVAARAKELGMKTHMDGARLFNAVVATGESAQVHCQNYDSVWVDFSKGLCAPFGAVMCGTEDFISRAWAWKHRLGGAMRQAGIMAAGCLYALEHHVERLATDHANARLLNDGLKRLPFIQVHHDRPETNIVFFDLVGTSIAPEAFLEKLQDRGLRIGFAGTGYRAVTYGDITEEHIYEALRAFATVLEELQAQEGAAACRAITGAAPRSSR